jgi:hypothetical protein
VVVLPSHGVGEQLRRAVHVAKVSVAASWFASSAGWSQAIFSVPVMAIGAIVLGPAAGG